jgi:hypothetical protein
VNTENKTELHEETSEAVERINTNLKERIICTIIGEGGGEKGKGGTRNKRRD